MANLAQDAVSKAKSFIIIIYPLTFVLLLVCLRLNLEDIQTTVAGYKDIGTAKIGDTTELGYAVAILLSGVPIAMGYWWSRNTSNVSLLVVAMACLAIDVFYDVSHKVTGYGANPTMPQYGTTITETLTIYTLGSEVLTSWCLGFLWEGMDEFGAALRTFIPSVFGLVAAIFDGTLTGGGKMMRVLEKHAPSVSLSKDDEQSVGAVVNGKKQQPDMFGGNPR